MRSHHVSLCAVIILFLTLADLRAFNTYHEASPAAERLCMLCLSEAVYCRLPALDNSCNGQIPGAAGRAHDVMHEGTLQRRHKSACTYMSNISV